MHEAMTCNIVAKLQHCTVKIKSNSTISRRSSEGSVLGLKSNGCRYEPTVCHYFSSNNVRLLAYTALQVKAHIQNEWSVTNQKVRCYGSRLVPYIKHKMK